MNTNKLQALLDKMIRHEEQVREASCFDMRYRLKNRRYPDNADENPNRKPVPWDEYYFDPLGFSRVVFGVDKGTVFKNWNDVSLYYYGIPAGSRTFVYLWSGRWLMVDDIEDQYGFAMERIKNIIEQGSLEKAEKFVIPILSEKLGI